MDSEFSLRTGHEYQGLIFKTDQPFQHSFAPVGLNAEVVGYRNPADLKIARLFDINSRGEVLEHEVDASFQQDGEVWKVSILTEIAGLKSSFEAVLEPVTWTLRTSGSVRGYELR